MRALILVLFLIVMIGLRRQTRDLICPRLQWREGEKVPLVSSKDVLVLVEGETGSQEGKIVDKGKETGK